MLKIKIKFKKSCSWLRSCCMHINGKVSEGFNCTSYNIFYATRTIMSKISSQCHARTFPPWNCTEPATGSGAQIQTATVFIHHTAEEPIPSIWVIKLFDRYHEPGEAASLYCARLIMFFNNFVLFLVAMLQKKRTDEPSCVIKNS